MIVAAATCHQCHSSATALCVQHCLTVIIASLALVACQMMSTEQAAACSKDHMYCRYFPVDSFLRFPTQRSFPAAVCGHVGGHYPA